MTLAIISDRVGLGAGGPMSEGVELGLLLDSPVPSRAKTEVCDSAKFDIQATETGSPSSWKFANLM